LNKEELITFEEGIKNLFLEKKILFPCHLSGGNEDRLIGIFKRIKEGDWVFSTHRNHYHALLHGFPSEELREWIIKYGSMHVYRERFFTSGIVGGILPIALGVALGIKSRGGFEKVWCFLGDMANHTGIAYECKKYAGRHDLPIEFIIEDNGYSVDTPTVDVWPRCWDNKERRYSYERVYPHQGSGEWVSF